MTDVNVQIGDTIHIAVEDAPPINAPTIAQPPTIAQLLTESRAAHKRFQAHTGAIGRDGKVRLHPNDDAAAIEVRAALAARVSAEQADPEHTDPAWTEDLAQNRGVSSRALVDFFQDYLL